MKGDNMQEKYNWEDIKTILQTDLNEIFNGTDITDMSDYEKRKMIFDHLVEKITYDYDKLNDIYKFKSGLIEKINRNLQKELIDTIIFFLHIVTFHFHFFFTFFSILLIYFSTILILCLSFSL